MKKLLGLLAVTSLVASTTGVVTACGEDVATKTDISSITTLVKNLGAFTSAPSASEIIAKFLDLNKEVEGMTTAAAADFEASAITATGATITAVAASTSYTGTADVTYTVTSSPVEKTNISSITTLVKELGAFTSAPSESEIIARFLDLNVAVEGMTTAVAADFEASAITATGATITAAAASTSYTGTVGVTFTIS